MRKVIAFALAVMLVMSLAVSAFAASSPVAPAASATKTSALPVVVDELPEGVTFVPMHRAHVLTAEDKDEFVTAQAALRKAAPEGMVAKYFFYVVCAGHDTFAFTMKTAAEEVAVMQFADGEWTELECTLNNDGTATVKGVAHGPLAIFTK